MKKRLLIQAGIFIPVCFLIMILLDIFLFEEEAWSKILVKSLFVSIGGVIGMSIGSYFYGRNKLK